MKKKICKQILRITAAVIVQILSVDSLSFALEFPLCSVDQYLSPAVQIQEAWLRHYIAKASPDQQIMNDARTIVMSAGIYLVGKSPFDDYKNELRELRKCIYKVFRNCDDKNPSLAEVIAAYCIAHNIYLEDRNAKKDADVLLKAVFEKGIEKPGKKELVAAVYLVTSTQHPLEQDVMTNAIALVNRSFRGRNRIKPEFTGVFSSLGILYNTNADISSRINAAQFLKRVFMGGRDNPNVLSMIAASFIMSSPRFSPDIRKEFEDRKIIKDRIFFETLQYYLRGLRYLMIGVHSALNHVQRYESFQRKTRESVVLKIAYEGENLYEDAVIEDVSGCDAKTTEKMLKKALTKIKHGSEPISHELMLFKMKVYKNLGHSQGRSLEAALTGGIFIFPKDKDTAPLWIVSYKAEGTTNIAVLNLVTAEVLWCGVRVDGKGDFFGVCQGRLFIYQAAQNRNYEYELRSDGFTPLPLVEEAADNVEPGISPVHTGAVNEERKDILRAI